MNRLHLAGHLRISTDTIKVPYVRVTQGKQCQHTDTLFKHQDPPKPYPVGWCLPTLYLAHTAISRKVVGENVHVTIPKGNMGYDQYTVPETVAVEPTFVAFF